MDHENENSTQHTVDAETAEREFERFAEAMCVDIDTSDMDPSDLAGFNRQKGRFIRAVQGGHLVVDSDGQAVYTPHHPRTKNHSPLTFQERSGASLMASDGKKDTHNVAKMYAIMGDMCGVHTSRFANMVGVDIKTCEAIFAFLMD